MRFIRFWIYMCIGHLRGAALSGICTSIEIPGKQSSRDSRACHSADSIMVGLDGGRIVMHVVTEPQLFASGMRVCGWPLPWCLLLSELMVRIIGLQLAKADLICIVIFLLQEAGGC